MTLLTALEPPGNAIASLSDRKKSDVKTGFST